jgi:hypothetical protein
MVQVEEEEVRLLMLGRLDQVIHFYQRMHLPLMLIDSPILEFHSYSIDHSTQCNINRLADASIMQCTFDIRLQKSSEK